MEKMPHIVRYLGGWRALSGLRLPHDEMGGDQCGPARILGLDDGKLVSGRQAIIGDMHLAMAKQQRDGQRLWCRTVPNTNIRHNIEQASNIED
jgi:hypothetical protein